MQAQELDILEMPVEALAAYWLSIKKLLDAKGDRNLIAIERENTGERYIRHLLDLALSGLDAERTRRLARAKASALLDEAERRFEMMRVALCGIAQNENPRLTFIRLEARMAGAPLTEKRAFDLARGLLAAASGKSADLPELLRVDHKQKDDRLAVKLLFYALAGRRSGRQALNEFLPQLGRSLFAEGLSLCADGLEPAFIAEQMQARRETLLRAARRKMRMAAEMCLAIRAGLAYDDVFRVARSFMV